MSTSGNKFEDEFIDEEVSADSEESDQGPAALKKLREKLGKAIEEKQEYLDGWQRSRADFANFKRDESGRSIELELRTKVELGEAVIPALDSFEMALRDKSFASADANLQKGFEAVYTHLLKSLERIGISRYEPQGEVFDPYKHEALREVKTDDPTLEHTIESIHRPGYAIGERILRPAQVSVYAKD